MNCRICERETRPRTPDFHVLEVSPIDGELCTGCWMAFVQMELFAIRAGCHVGIGGYVKIEQAMRDMLKLFPRDEEGAA